MTITKCPYHLGDLVRHKDGTEFWAIQDLRWTEDGWQALEPPGYEYQRWFAVEDLFPHLTAEKEMAMSDTSASGDDPLNPTQVRQALKALAVLVLAIDSERATGTWEGDTDDSYYLVRGLAGRPGKVPLTLVPTAELQALLDGLEKAVRSNETEWVDANIIRLLLDRAARAVAVHLEGDRAAMSDGRCINGVKGPHTANQCSAAVHLEGTEQ